MAYLRFTILLFITLFFASALSFGDEHETKFHVDNVYVGSTFGVGATAVFTTKEKGPNKLFALVMHDPKPRVELLRIAGFQRLVEAKERKSLISIVYNDTDYTVECLSSDGIQLPGYEASTNKLDCPATFAYRANFY